MHALDATGVELTQKDLLAYLESAIEHFNTKGKPTPTVGQAEAFYQLIGEDLTTVRSLLTRYREFWESPLEHRLRSTFDLIQQSMRELGIPIDYAQFGIVDKYPSPYEELAFWAMNFDETDRQRYGLQIGTRLRRDFLMPFYSESLLAHELVHACFGRVRGTKLARGLEEGIADIFGHLLIAGRFLPWEICENILLSTRCFQPQSPFWMNYAESLRQASLLLFESGLTGLISLARKAQQVGRDYLREIEHDLLRGTMPAMPRSHCKIPDWAIQSSKRILDFCRKFLAFPQSLCVSPLAYEIASKARVGENFSSLCERLALDQPQAEKALSELRERVFLMIVCDKDTISFNESPIYVDTRSLRYTAIDTQ